MIGLEGQSRSMGVKTGTSSPMKEYLIRPGPG